MVLTAPGEAIYFTKRAGKDVFVVFDDTGAALGDIAIDVADGLITAGEDVGGFVVDVGTSAANGVADAWEFVF